MLIMECRYACLKKLLAALDHVAVSLVGFDGTKLVPFLNFDDVGLYIFIPKIVHFFQVSLDQAINIFFYSQLGMSFILGFFGFFLLFRSWQSLLFTLFLFIFFICFSFYSAYDVYTAYLVSMMSIIPLFLYFMVKDDESKFFNYFMIFAGLVISFTQYIRSYSSLPVLGFIVCMLLLNQKIVSYKKVVLLCCMIVGIGISTAYFKMVLYSYQKFAKTHFLEYEKQQTKHPLWHVIYLGFGLLKIENKDNITWDDSFGEKKAKEIDPTVSLVQTTQYENILKNEVFNLFKNQRGFVIWTIFAKIGILLWYILLFANFGLLAFFCFARRWDLDIAFLCASALSAITPILTLPYYQYALSFITLSFIFGLYYSNEFFEQQKIRSLLKLKIHKKDNISIAT